MFNTNNMTKLELVEALQQREESFQKLSIAGCTSSCVMAPLKDVIGRLRVAIAELNLEEAKENYVPMWTSYPTP